MIIGLCVGMVALGILIGLCIAAWGAAQADERNTKIAKTGRCPTCGRWP